MKKKHKLTMLIALLAISTSIFAQLPEEIQWKHLEKIYAQDSTQLILKLNNKTLEGAYKIPFEEGGFALYEIKKGKITGDAFWYSSAGNMECKLRYKNGVRNGLKENYDRDGNVWLKQEFKDGKQNGINEMYTNGKLSNESSYKNGKKNGLQRTYSDGNVISQTEYKDDLKDGVSKTYDTNGNLITEVNYAKDLQDGLTTMYALGNKTMDFIYEKGEKHGISHMYKPDGSVVFTSYFIHGEKVDVGMYNKYMMKTKE